MTASRSLPARPSLDSLRKQAKKLARDIAGGDAGAVARARAHLPKVDLPLTQRNAQLVIAREYGFAGWQDLVAEASRRVGRGLEWAAAQAERAIHDNDVVGLKRLLAEYPALLSWTGDERHRSLIEMATGAYGDAFGAEREHWFTRATCAELLIEQGAIVLPQVAESILRSRAVGMLHLFERKGLLPGTLMFRVALGQIDAVRALVTGHSYPVTTLTDAFICACRFEHPTIASLLLERTIALDPELGRRIGDTTSRDAFVAFFSDRESLDFDHARAGGLWRAFTIGHVVRAFHAEDLASFERMLEREPWLLGEDYVWFQNDLIGKAGFNHDRGAFIRALFERDAAILRQQPPPPSEAIAYAITYANTELIPLLTRIWPLPDDLPHSAGTGDLARVKQWFDASGAPALGDLDRHYPHTSPHLRAHDDLRWGAPSVNHVLDTALAWSVINRHFDVADFLLAHGADINTSWNSHEPASILHHLVFLPDSYESMRFLIDRGIDMTIKDYRWTSDATGWARYGKGDEDMARWLENAARERARAAE
jgi:ankyrin repeat protein